MRLLAIIFLTSLMMLSASPQMSAAGPVMHDCAACPETVIPTDQKTTANHHQANPLCADMATCASYALLDTNKPLRGDDDILRLRHAWPEPRNGMTISLSLDLPPPRI